MITARYKNGDVTNPENYRPICGLQQLYKLLSTMLCNRLRAVLDRHQCADQAGFSKTFRPFDDLQTHIPEKQRMVNGHMGGSDRLQGIRFK